MRVTFLLLTLVIISHSSIASQPTPAMRAMEEDDTLFQPVAGMYAGMDETQLKDAQQKKVVEVNTYQGLIGAAKVEDLKDMLQEAKNEKRAGCIMGWSSKGLTAASGVTSALATALGAPSWVTYLTAAVTIITPIVSHIADYLKEDAGKIKKNAIKCYADSIKELGQINDLLRAKTEASSAQATNQKLALQVDRIQRHLLARPTGDVILNLEDDAEEEGDSKGKEEGGKKALKRRGMFVKVKKKSSSAMPAKPPVTVGQTPAQLTDDKGQAATPSLMEEQNIK